MNTVERAWATFMKALDEARELHRADADPLTVAEILRHARELLDVIEAEIAANQIDIPAGAAIAVLRGRLESLEKQVLPTRH